MDEPVVNRWAGKSAEELLGEVLHHLRAPIHLAVGSLTVLKTVDQLSPEQKQQMIELGLNAALRAKDVIDSVSQYMTEKRNK